MPGKGGPPSSTQTLELPEGYTQDDISVSNLGDDEGLLLEIGRHGTISLLGISEEDFTQAEAIDIA